MKRFCSPLIYILSGVILISAITLAVLNWWPLNPIELKEVKILNADNIVKIGHPILFRVSYAKHTSKHGFVVRQLINDRVVNYTTIASRVATGEGQKIGRIHTSVGDIPGTYHVKYTVVYKYFGFREVATSAVSDEFELVERGR
ncbi:MAG: hypothetical protein WC346_18255 [Methanogenium sp.]|jgi:hypothetical protein